MNKKGFFEIFWGVRRGFLSEEPLVISPLQCPRGVLNSLLVPTIFLLIIYFIEINKLLD